MGSNRTTAENPAHSATAQPVRRTQDNGGSCMVSNRHIFRRAILRRLAGQVATLVALTGIGAGCSDSSGPSQPDVPSQLDLLTLEAVTPTDLTGVVATGISPPPTLRVRDQNGKPIADILVSFQPSGTGAVANAA